MINQLLKKFLESEGSSSRIQLTSFKLVSQRSVLIIPIQHLMVNQLLKKFVGSESSSSRIQFTSPNPVPQRSTSI